MHVIRTAFIILGLLFFVSLQALAGPAKFAYQGQIVKDNGQALEANSVQFKIEILSPSPSLCVLYEESHTINMTASNGIFNLTVGEGVRPGTGTYQDLSTLSEALDNSIGLVTPTDCVSGPTYTAANSDGRKLRLTFNDGSGPVTLTQDHNIVSVPYAANATSVDGLTASDLLQINTDVGFNLDQTNLDFVFNDANWTELQALLDGTSTSFGTYTAPTSDVDNNNQKIINLDDPTADGDATNKGYVDGNIGGQAVNTADLDALGPGNSDEVLAWDGSQWESRALDDTTKLPLAGGTMTGNLNMGSQDITNANDIAAGNDVSVGNNLTVSGGIGVTNGMNSGAAINLNNESELRFSENTGNGTDYVALKAPAALAGNVVWTLPGADGLSGQMLQTNGSGTLSWSDPSSLGYIQDGGNATGSTIVVGTNDAQSLEFETNNATVMTIDSGGNVGIGTTSPLSKLHVEGNLVVENTIRNNTDSILKLISGRDMSPSNRWGIAFETNDATNTPQTRLNIRRDDIIAYNELIALGGLTGGAAAGQDLILESTSSTTKGEVIIQPTGGNVGIGTTSPLRMLTLSGSDFQAGILQENIDGDAGGQYPSITQYSYNAGHGALVGGRANGTKALPTVASPSITLQTVVGQAHDGTDFKEVGRISIKSGDGFGAADIDGKIEFQVRDANVANTAMVIQETGFIGVGTTEPSKKLEVVGTVKATAFEGDGSLLTGVVATNSAAGESTGNYIINTDSDGSTGDGGVLFQTNGGTVASISESGNIGAAAGTVGAVGIGFQNDSDTGIYSPALDTISLSAGGVEGLRVSNTPGGVNYVEIIPGATGVSPLITAEGADLDIDLTLSPKGTGNTIFSAGSLGIGTTTPTGKLHVTQDTGAMQKGIVSSRYGAAHGAAGASFASYFMGGTEASPVAPTVGNVANSLSFFTGGTGGTLFANPSFSIRHTIQSPQAVGLSAVDTSFMVNSTSTGNPFSALTLQGQTGNVGIGTIAPGGLLEIGTNSVTSSSIRFLPSIVDQTSLRFTSSSAANWIQSGVDYAADSKKDLRFSSINGNTTWMAIQGSTGNVGIGTTTPMVELDVDNGVINASALCDENNANCIDLSSGVTASSSSSSSNPTNYVINADDDGNGSGDILFQSNGSTLGSFTNGGNFVVGSNQLLVNPSADSVGISGATGTIGALNIDTDVTVKPDIHFDGSGSLASDSSIQIYIDGDNDSTSSMFRVSKDSYINASSVELFRIQEDGNVGIGTTSPEAALDVSAQRWTEGGVSPPQIGVRGSRAAIALYDTNQVGANIMALESGEGQLRVYSTDYTADDWGFDERVARMTIDGNSGNVGVGTTTPYSQFEVVGESFATSRIFNTIYEDGASAPGFIARKARGTIASPTAVQSGDYLATLGGRGYYSGGAFGSNSVGSFGVLAAENFTSSAQGTHLIFHTTAIGATSSTEKMRVTAGGNVGLGTSSPNANFHVLSSGYTEGLIESGGTQNAALELKAASGSSYDFHSTGSGAGTGAGHLQIRENGSTRLLIQSSTGNVGIGTTNPTFALHARSTSAATTGYFESTNTATVIGFSDTNTTFRPQLGSSGNDLFLQTSGSTRMVVDSAGNVGVGTTSPNSRLQVAGGIRSAKGTHSGDAGNVGYSFDSDGDTGLFAVGGSANNNSDLILAVDNSEKMRIGDNGNVGIGTTVPAHTLHVQGDAGKSTGTAWINTSDRRLKDIRGNFDYGLEELLKLRTVRFNYKKGNPLDLPSDKEVIGFIAQEVMTVIPEAVNKREDGFYELDVDPIHWTTVNAVQDLAQICLASEEDLKVITQKVEKHDRDIASLKRENTELKEMVKQLQFENQNLNGRLNQLDQKLDKILELNKDQ